jgi:ASC-1-like (ASCH) protein
MISQFPVKYKKHVSQPWFFHIKNGSKKCEGRLNKGDFALMKSGDEITFQNEDTEFTMKIDNIVHYSSFADYLRNEGIDHCLPGINDMDEGVAVYHQYYSREDEAKYGVVCIRLRNA